MTPSPVLSDQRATSLAIRDIAAELGFCLSTGNPQSATGRATAGCLARRWEMHGAPSPIPGGTGWPQRVSGLATHRSSTASNSR
eukprot:8263609-Alexandrium_andersonii.AAC.1